MEFISIQDLHLEVYNMSVISIKEGFNTKHKLILDIVTSSLL